MRNFGAVAMPVFLHGAVCGFLLNAAEWFTHLVARMNQVVGKTVLVLSGTSVCFMAYSRLFPTFAIFDEAESLRFQKKTGKVEV
jgi:hypothetical protein